MELFYDFLAVKSEDNPDNCPTTEWLVILLCRKISSPITPVFFQLVIENVKLATILYNQFVGDLSISYKLLNPGVWSIIAIISKVER